MVKFFNQGQSANLTADGSNNGTLTVTSTDGFFPGATAWIRSSVVDGTRVVLRDIVDGTHLIVGVIAVGDHRRFNATAYLLADGATINQEPQLVSSEVGRV